MRRASIRRRVIAGSPGPVPEGFTILLKGSRVPRIQRFIVASLENCEVSSPSRSTQLSNCVLTPGRPLESLRVMAMVPPRACIRTSKEGNRTIGLIISSPQSCAGNAGYGGAEAGCWLADALGGHSN